MVGGRRASRGVGRACGAGAEACAEMLKAGLSHLIEIALAHPEYSPFVWSSAGEADMAPQPRCVKAQRQLPPHPHRARARARFSSQDTSPPMRGLLSALVTGHVSADERPTLGETCAGTVVSLFSSLELF
jgi:hypothetical protein